MAYAAISLPPADDPSKRLLLAQQRDLSLLGMRHLLAIINEAFANLVRHAKARNVLFKANELGEKLQIMIKDNGIGFSPNARYAYGLRNMRDPVRLLNGELQFSEPSNKGTIEDRGVRLYCDRGERLFFGNDYSGFLSG